MIAGGNMIVSIPLFVLFFEENFDKILMIIYWVW